VSIKKRMVGWVWPECTITHHSKVGLWTMVGTVPQAGGKNCRRGQNRVGGRRTQRIAGPKRGGRSLQSFRKVILIKTS
jgi:hypothetical protein